MVKRQKVTRGVKEQGGFVPNQNRNKPTPRPEGNKWSEQFGINSIHLTESQQELRKKILNNDLTFVVGSSGSGKSMTVLYTYVQEYLKDPSKQLIIVRTPVEAGLDKIGALPNSLTEKIEPHFNSTKVLLQDLLSKGKVETDLDHRIHFKIPNYMLGSTFDRSLILIDECFDESHEFLTKTGWKNVKDITEYDEVLQFNEDHTSEFVKPLRVIHKKYSGNLYKFNTGAVSFAVTENHRLVFEDSKKELTIKLAKDTCGSNWFTFTSSFGNIENPEYDITDDEIKLAVAVQADGSIQQRPESRVPSCQITISRQRKIDRLLSIKHNFHEVKESKGKRRFYCGNFNSKLLCNTSKKNFNLDIILKLSQRQLRLFVEECKYWDGSVTRGDSFVYCSTNEHNVDVVQIAACMTGFTSNKTVQIDERKESYKDYYRLFIRDTNIRSTTQRFDENKTCEKYDGDVHCVQVPSGMIITRRNGKVHVSGNCQQLSPLILKLILERTGVDSKVCVLGDNSQLYVDSKGRNALRDAIPRFFNTNGEAKFPNVAYHEFNVEDVVRSELTKTIIRAYS